MCDSGGAENVEKTPVVACIPVFNEESEVVGVLEEALVLDEASHVGCISRLRLT